MQAINWSVKQNNAVYLKTVLLDLIKVFCYCAVILKTMARILRWGSNLNMQLCVLVCHKLLIKCPVKINLTSLYVSAAVLLKTLHPHHHYRTQSSHLLLAPDGRHHTGILQHSISPSVQSTCGKKYTKV